MQIVPLTPYFKTMPPLPPLIFVIIDIAYMEGGLEEKGTKGRKLLHIQFFFNADGLKNVI